MPRTIPRPRFTQVSCQTKLPSCNSIAGNSAHIRSRRIMMHRWGRAPLSCRPCREKKRRCDRQRPCSSCTLRSIECRYADDDPSSQTIGQRPQDTYSHTIYPSPAVTSTDSSHSDDVLRRLQRLEEAVFNKSGQSEISPQTGASNSEGLLGGFTPFGLHLMTQGPDEATQQREYLVGLTAKMPPVSQARILLEHFAVTSHPNCGILHIPSCRKLLEETYGIVKTDGIPLIENLLLLFTVFAGAAFAWSPRLLQQLHATRAEAKAAYVEYVHLGMSIVDNTVRPLAPSTTALAAMGNLNFITTHARGLSDNAVALRMKCYGMARTLQIDRLDTSKSREERRRKGCNMIDVELQRRVWWNLIGVDWLNAFSGGPNDGAYFIQPKHMNVRLPANMDDVNVTADMIEQEVPLSVPSDMTAFIHRVRISELCREVVDALPSQFHDVEEVDYQIILEMDKKFRKFLDELPVFFRLDLESIEQSKSICRERPMIGLQRIFVNFSIHVRLCRLHRPYHLEGLTNPNYAYSHKACIGDAQRVLDLRRIMEEYGAPLGMNPTRSWIVMQHVSIAALILATDVSFNPQAENAANRKSKVLATCELLEKSIEESGSIMEGVQRNMQTLISTLQKERSESVSQGRNTTPHITTDSEQPRDTVMADDVGQVLQTMGGDTVGFAVGSDGFLDDLVTDQSDWDKMWKDFMTIAPELDMAQWDLLFADVDSVY